MKKQKYNRVPSYITNFYRSLLNPCYRKDVVDAYTKVMRYRQNGLITDYETVRALVDVHESFKNQIVI